MKIKVKRKVNAPKDVLWNYLADYSNIQRFNPLIKGSHFIEGTQTCEVGSTRQCDMMGGNYIKERVDEWVEGSHYSVDIYESSLPFKSAKAKLGVYTTGKNTSEIYMHMDVVPKYMIMAPMVYLMYKYYGAPAILKGLDDLYKKEKALSLA